MPGLHLKGVT